jgi:hypothetical protein
MCDHDFQLGTNGQVSCVKCFVSDDEMELPSPKSLDEDEDVDAPPVDFWATQVSFEE